MNDSQGFKCFKLDACWNLWIHWPFLRCSEHSQSGGTDNWSPRSGWGGSGGDAQFAFLLGTEAWRRGWFTAENVEVFSIKVVMETLIMRVFPKPTPPGREKNRGTRTELWEIWTSRDGEGKRWSVKRKPQCEVREDKKGVNLKKVQ